MRLALLPAMALASGVPALPRPQHGDVRRVEVVAAAERSVATVLAEGPQAGGRSRRGASLGSGVVLSGDGLLLTAAHVVAGAERIAVKVFGAGPVPARLVFLDRSADVALVRLAPSGVALHPAVLGDSDRLRKGEAIYVIGNPGGLERSLSVGVVSGRHPLGQILGGAVEADLIQTDAAMNPGNSGGPMFDSSGAVIGLAQAIVSEGGGSQGLGFGLPINTVKKLLDLDPCVWLGFSAFPLDAEWADALNVRAPSAALVQRVEPDGAAAVAGLREGTIPVDSPRGKLLLGGDVILAVDGKPYLDWVRSSAPSQLRPGTRHVLMVTLMRAGAVIDLPMPVVHRPKW